MILPMAMSRPTQPEPGVLPLVLVVVVNAAALMAFACSPYAGEYPLAALSIAAFLLAQLLLPACRPVLHTPLCPGNLAQAFFWAQLVLVALLIGCYGVREGTLPQLPCAAAINAAIALRVVAYLVFCVAYQLGGGSAAGEQGVDTPRSPTAESVPGRPLLIGTFLVLGFVGQVFLYQSLNTFIDYLTSPALQREHEAPPPTLAGAASTFLRPFLGFALVLLWAGWIQGKGRRQGVVVQVAATAGLAVLLLVANFSYNRGALLAPLLALTAAYARHVRRLSLLTLGIGATLVLAGALTLGWYRSTDLDLGELASADLGETWSEDHLTEFFQIYASGPQMTAYLIEQRGPDAPLAWGQTMLCSALYPLPVLGKPFRDGSGVALLNMLIYQDPDNTDQVIPYDAELYVNFHLPGVVLGYALLGWAVRRAHGRFLQTRDAAASYAWLLLGLWAVFPGSLPVLSQMYIYFFWPFYVYFAVGFLGRLARQAPRPAGAFVGENGA